MKPLSRQYLIKNSHLLVTPALVVFPEIIEMNIKQMVKMSSDPLKLRPHVKTYKMAEVVKLQLNHGIKKFKAATFAQHYRTVSEFKKPFEDQNSKVF